MLFGVFFGAAVLYRKKPEIHKRLILLATVALLFAAVSRMRFIGQRPILLLVWLSPVLVAIGYEGLTRRRVHPTYLIGLAILLTGFTRTFLVRSESWVRIGRALLKPLM